MSCINRDTLMSAFVGIKDVKTLTAVFKDLGIRCPAYRAKTYLGQTIWGDKGGGHVLNVLKRKLRGRTLDGITEIANPNLNPVTLRKKELIRMCWDYREKLRDLYANSFENGKHFDLDKDCSYSMSYSSSYVIFKDAMNPNLSIKINCDKIDNNEYIKFKESNMGKSVGQGIIDEACKGVKNSKESVDEAFKKFGEQLKNVFGSETIELGWLVLSDETKSEKLQTPQNTTPESNTRG